MNNHKVSTIIIDNPFKQIAEKMRISKSVVSKYFKEGD